MFSAKLVNDPFGDPALYLEMRYRREAILFDLGEIRTLAPRLLLKTDHVFVTHTHVDHFIGFDHLLRLCLGREKRLHLYGPPGFIGNVEGKLSAYTWNLVVNYENNFTIVVHEIHPDRAETVEFRVQQAFKRCDAHSAPFDGCLLEKNDFRVKAIFLDHKVPCLAFSLEERFHVNILKNALTDLGLEGGPWLNELKACIYRAEPDDTAFRVWWKGADGIVERIMALGELRSKIVKITPGQKITYVSDVIHSAANVDKIIAFAGGADLLVIESCFLHEDSRRADEKYHLTARQAGELARRAQVTRFTLFHFSPKYKGEEHRFVEEAMRAFKEGV